jgi:hypothetical protein
MQPRIIATKYIEKLDQQFIIEEQNFSWSKVNVFRNKFQMLDKNKNKNQKPLERNNLLNQTINYRTFLNKKKTITVNNKKKQTFHFRYFSQQKGKSIDRIF